ncbi:hypothetical protein BDV19DRAFT_397043 [Aspergillus venezuelensis]
MKTYNLDVPLARDPAIAVTVLGALATLTTVLRFISLQMRRVKPGAAEYLIVAALVIVYIFIAIQWILSVAGGAGRHVAEVDPSSVIVTLKTILPLEALYGIVMSLVKTSIMVFYLKIFGTKKSFRISVGITMTIVWLWAISVVLETLLLCRPLAFNWDTTIPGGSCGNRNATYVVAGTLNLVTDLMVMGLPIPHIWRLQLGVAKKIALSVVFCMGLLVSIISIVRLVALMAIDFNDITHSVQMGVLWTVVEPELAILCANMPILKPVLSRMFPKLFSTHQRTYGVSDPQAFERLGESGGYSLNRVNRDPTQSNIYAGDYHLQSKYTTATTRSLDQESRESDQQRLRDHEQEVPGINVTQNFNIRYTNK